ncbi:MAG TPA: ATP-binding protein [Puia sp.]|nr:ATP-binding protein [Puia sp.]
MRIVFNARFALQRKIAWLLVFSFVSLSFIGWLIYFNKRDVENTTFWLNHTYAVITQIDKIKTRISAWDSVSGRPPNRSFYAALGKDLNVLQQLTEDNPEQGQRVLSFSSTLNTRTGNDSLSLASLKDILRDMMHRERELLSQRRLMTRTADKKVTLLLISGSLMAFLLIFVILMRLNKDIVLRKEAEDKLRESQTWLQAILDNTTSLIYIKDPEGRYIMINRRFQEVIGVKAEDLIGKTDQVIAKPQDADQYKELDKEVMRTGRSLEIETVVPSAGTDVHLLSVKFPLLGSNGQRIGIGGVATDITERVMQQQQLIAAIAEAQNAKSMQELFLANMSHEIRTPMNGIQGMTDLLLGTPLTSQQREFAGIIKRSVNNLLVIVNDVLDFSKIKAGKLAIEKIEFRLMDVLDNITAMFGHRMNKKELSWQVDIDPKIPEVLRGDPYRLNQVLINLVGNALKFTEQGQIRVKVSLQECGPRQVELAFAVSDTGIGIAEDSLPHIFDHFSQAGLDISRRYGGTGLGLAICHQLLKLQGGDISVSSLVGKGTTFNFHLPYEYDGEQQTDAPAPIVLTDYSQCLAGKRFLVAEDNEVNQQLVDHVLKRGGGTVQLVGNGEEALQYLRQGESYDLIIMDLQMPVMDGYEATRSIRQDLELTIPIIAMTATALVGEQLRCFDAGMNDYMTKPFEFTELYKRILALLENTPVIRSQTY